VNRVMSGTSELIRLLYLWELFGRALLDFRVEAR
jgi:hypothetical protein